MLTWHPSSSSSSRGVVGWCDGVMYLTSPGRPTDIGYSWARPAILIAGKGRRGNVFITSVASLSFLFFFLPCPSLSSILLSLLSLISLSLGDDRKWPTRDVSLNPNTINQSSSRSPKPLFQPPPDETFGEYYSSCHLSWYATWLCSEKM